MITLKEFLSQDSAHQLQLSIDDPRKALAVQFRALCLKLQIDAERWGQLMDAYEEDSSHSLALSNAERTARRSNLARRLLSDDMSWDTFLLGMAFLQVSPLQITISAVAKIELAAAMLESTTVRIDDLKFSDLLKSND